MIGNHAITFLQGAVLALQPARNEPLPVRIACCKVIHQYDIPAAISPSLSLSSVMRSNMRRFCDSKYKDRLAKEAVAPYRADFFIVSNLPT